MVGNVFLNIGIVILYLVAVMQIEISFFLKLRYIVSEKNILVVYFFVGFCK